MKVCRVCDVEKPSSEYYSHPRTADKLLALCKECQKQASKDRHDRLRNDPGYKQANARRARIRLLRDKYGMSLTEYDAMLVSQENCCAICASPYPGVNFSVFPVDHDHATGEVRGLLCNDCNLGLQRFKDSPELLMTAAAYLLTQVNLLNTT